jgi:hypothetical protein
MAAKTLEETEYDYVVYIDSDCAFVDFGTKLEKFIDSMGNKDLLFFSNRPYNWDRPCSGFFICKNSPNAKLFLNTWFNYDKHTEEAKTAWSKLGHSWDIGTFYEQDALWIMFNNPNVIMNIDEVMFHDHPGQFLKHICHMHGLQVRNQRFRSMVTQLENSGFLQYETAINQITSIPYDTSNGSY